MKQLNYISRLPLFHFYTESNGGAFEAKVVTAGEHENVFGYFLALGAGLWLFHRIGRIYFFLD